MGVLYFSCHSGLRQRCRLADIPDDDQQYCSTKPARSCELNRLYGHGPWDGAGDDLSWSDLSELVDLRGISLLFNFFCYRVGFISTVHLSALRALFLPSLTILSITFHFSPFNFHFYLFTFHSFAGVNGTRMTRMILIKTD